MSARPGKDFDAALRLIVDEVAECLSKYQMSSDTVFLRKLTYYKQKPGGHYAISVEWCPDEPEGDA